MTKEEIQERYKVSSAEADWIVVQCGGYSQQDIDCVLYWRAKGDYQRAEASVQHKENLLRKACAWRNQAKERLDLLFALTKGDVE